jgi:hypothetical protein
MKLWRRIKEMPLKYDPKYVDFPALQEYFIPFGTLDFYSGLEAAILAVALPMRAVSEAFLANLRSAEATVSMPFYMASAAAQGKRFQLILASERIRALGKESEHDKLAAIALPIAEERFKQEMSSPDHKEFYVQECLGELSQSLSNGEMRTAAQELLRTSLVLVWGAVEVLISDAFEITLNLRPELYDVLLGSENLKRKMNLKALTFEDLKRFEFNISGRLGTLLLENTKLDKVAIIRDVFDALEPNDAKVRELLHSNGFWLMWQTRNLIVHRRATVDRQYQDLTGDKSSKIGERLRIHPAKLEEYLELARDIGINLILALSRLVSAPSAHKSSEQ